MELDVVFDTPNAADFSGDAALARLYEHSFPANEREPLAVIAGTLASGHGLVVRATLRGETVGFASAHHVRIPNVTFLVYLTIEPSSRSRGLGGALFEHVWLESRRRFAASGQPPQAYVWELDPPALATSHDDRDLRNRRFEFFRRRGGHIWLESYLQPPVNGPVAVPMLLAGRLAPGASERPIDAVVRGIYFEKYGFANGLDANLLENLLARSLPPDRSPTPAR